MSVIVYVGEPLEVSSDGITDVLHLYEEYESFFFRVHHSVTSIYHAFKEHQKR
jgi:hypothetical protein